MTIRMHYQARSIRKFYSDLFWVLQKCYPELLRRAQTQAGRDKISASGLSQSGPGSGSAGIGSGSASRRVSSEPIR
jgi:hypothetical protein